MDHPTDEGDRPAFRDRSEPNPAEPGSGRDRALIARLRSQLEALRGQVRRLHGALGDERRISPEGDGHVNHAPATAPSRDPGHGLAEPFAPRTVTV
jgi:hypothetical protein